MYLCRRAIEHRSSASQVRCGGVECVPARLAGRPDMSGAESADGELPGRTQLAPGAMDAGCGATWHSGANPALHPGRHADRSCENVEDAYEITVVGEQCFGCQDATLRTNTLRLARAAGVDLLSVRFSRDEGRFLSANVWPPLTDAAVIVAVHEALENRRETRR